ncbi:AHH domain-containing protein [Marinibactrum halimedae]|nr:AHH domain-containing protein [Marinibactrum halimedae]MCD9460190.1 AHH domain-containing protein [Marinibactrum halimedae]
MFPDIKFPQRKVDMLITGFAKKDKPSIADFAILRSLGKLYDRLDNYRIEANTMNVDQLESEQHKSRRLGRFMTQAGDIRPSSHCDAHAIVSGSHPDALVIRGVLAWLKMRIDDPHNGCWLPRDWEDRKYMPNHLRNAVPHRRIHTGAYYEWLAGKINIMRIRTPEQLIDTLRLVRTWLQSGAVPPEVMPTTGIQ